MPVKDARSKSLSEAFVNSFGSYPIGYALGIVILPLSVGWIQEDPFTVNLIITAIYATVSFARSYFYRRLFERFGMDDNFIRLGIKCIRRLHAMLKPKFPHKLLNSLLFKKAQNNCKMGKNFVR